MAGQKKRKLAQILNLGSWATKKKIKSSASVPAKEGVIPSIATSSNTDINKIRNATWLDHDGMQGDGITHVEDDSDGLHHKETSHVSTYGDIIMQSGVPEEESDKESANSTGDGGESDSEGVGNVQDDEKNKLWLPPSIEAAHAAHTRLDAILNPRRNTGAGHKDPSLDLFLRSRLEGMKRFLWNYTNPRSRFYEKWIAASVDTATASEKGPWFARRLREWSSAFIMDDEELPYNVYGTWKKSRLDDEDLKQEISEHLQSIGKFISAMDIVRYLDQPDVKARHCLKKTITERTARDWLKKMGYRWKIEPHGQYVDGHERKDVADYRQNTFLPKWKTFECRM